MRTAGGNPSIVERISSSVIRYSGVSGISFPPRDSSAPGIDARKLQPLKVALL